MVSCCALALLLSWTAPGDRNAGGGAAVLTYWLSTPHATAKRRVMLSVDDISAINVDPRRREE
uniref:Uncharacterized protein n=1 Tax=Arundo donax TaxID=35708 RepID=A0A0A8ZGB1_ARUDO